MKKITLFLFMIAVSVVYSCKANYADDGLSMVNFTPEDFYPVSQVQKYTNITFHDVEKYKLLFIGENANEILKAGLGLWAGWKGYRAAEPFGKHLDYGMSWIPEGYRPSQNTQLYLKNNIAWSAVAAGGTLVMLYPLLYERTYQGLKNKLDKFAEYCQDKAGPLALYSYSSYQDLKKRAPMGLKKDVQLYLVLENLLKQAEYALLIMSDILDWTDGGRAKVDLETLNGDIGTYALNLRHNKEILLAHSTEMKSTFANRKNATTEEYKFATDEANLVLKQNKARKSYSDVVGSYVDTATKVFKFIGGITAYTAGFVRDYKAELATLSLGALAGKMLFGRDATVATP